MGKRDERRKKAQERRHKARAGVPAKINDQLAQRHRFENVPIDAASGRTTKRHTTLDPFDRYFRMDLLEHEKDADTAPARRRIAAERYCVGGELREDWYVCGHSPGVVANLLSVGGGPRDMTERQVAAHEKLRRAFTVAGSIGSALLISVCCMGENARDAERRHGWRKGYAMVRLREALDTAGPIYGLRDDRGRRAIESIIVY